MRMDGPRMGRAQAWRSAFAPWQYRGAAISQAPVGGAFMISKTAGLPDRWIWSVVSHCLLSASIAIYLGEYLGSLGVGLRG